MAAKGTVSTACKLSCVSASQLKGPVYDISSLVPRLLPMQKDGGGAWVQGYKYHTLSPSVVVCVCFTVWQHMLWLSGRCVVYVDTCDQRLCFLAMWNPNIVYGLSLSWGRSLRMYTGQQEAVKAIWQKLQRSWKHSLWGKSQGRAWNLCGTSWSCKDRGNIRYATEFGGSLRTYI